MGQKVHAFGSLYIDKGWLTTYVKQVGKTGPRMRVRDLLNIKRFVHFKVRGNSLFNVLVEGGAAV